MSVSMLRRRDPLQLRPPLGDEWSAQRATPVVGVHPAVLQRNKQSRSRSAHCTGRDRGVSRVRHLVRGIRGPRSGPRAQSRVSGQWLTMTGRPHLRRRAGPTAPSTPKTRKDHTMTPKLVAQHPVPPGPDPLPPEPGPSPGEPQPPMPTPPKPGPDPDPWPPNPLPPQPISSRVATSGLAVHV